MYNNRQVVPYRAVSRAVRPYRRPLMMGLPGAALAMAPYAARGAYNLVRRGVNALTTRGRPVQRVQPVTIVSKKVMKKNRPRKPVTLKKQVKNLQKAMNNMTSTLTYRYLDSARLATLSNQTTYDKYAHNDLATIEAALAQLRFFDPATPGTLVNASGATGTYSRNFRVKSSSVYTFRNNYQVPVELRVYKYKCKSDTTIDPYTAFTNGLVDIGNPAVTSMAVYPSDVSQIKDTWTPSSCTIWNLKPGGQKSFTLNSKYFEYNPADTDAQTQSYQKQYDCQFLMLRVTGPPSHDKTTATQVGTIAAGIDLTRKRTLIVKYNSGGADLEYLYVSDNLTAQTAGPVVSQLIADNQEFSTA